MAIEQFDAKAAEKPESLRPAASRLLDAVDVAGDGAAGLSARLAYLGLTAQLHVDMFSVNRAMAASGSPVAQTLLENAADMKANGWQFLKSRETGPVGQYDAETRRLWYQPQGSMLKFVLGADQSPINETVPIVAHELAHHDRVPFTPPKTGDEQVNRIMAQRLINSEVGAVLTQVHMNDQLSVRDRLDPDYSTNTRREALRTGNLGQHLWAKTRLTQEFLDGEAVNQSVPGYIERTYGKDVIDPATGKVRAFDLKAGYGIIAEPLPEDAATVAFRENNYLATRASNTDYRTSVGQNLQLGEHGWQSALTHGGNALGALALFSVANDVVGAFAESPTAGVARLSKVGVDWGGYELGTRVAAVALRSLMMRNPVMATIGIVASGFAGSYLADASIGQRLETTIRDITA